MPIPIKKIIIKTNKLESLLLKQEPYTLINGETQKNYCKIITNIRISKGDEPFTLGYAKDKIMRFAGKRTIKHYPKSGHTRPVRENIGDIEANKIISDLLQAGYLKYVTTQKRDKIHPNIPEAGVKFFIFDKYKVIECEESKYFRAKEQRKLAVTKEIGTLSEKRCRALRQIYAQFEDKLAFTYQMVKDIPSFYKQMAEKKDEKISDTTRKFYFQAAHYAESNRTDFLDTWNSLIRNGYILPHKIKTKDGTIKLVQGAYKVNMVYVKRCLTEKSI